MLSSNIWQVLLSNLWDEICKFKLTRYERLLATYKTSGTKMFMKKLISYDFSNLPAIAIFIYYKYLANSNFKMPTVPKPEDNGWSLIGRNYILNWFEGNTVPFVYLRNIITTAYWYCWEWVKWSWRAH